MVVNACDPLPACFFQNLSIVFACATSADRGHSIMTQHTTARGFERHAACPPGPQAPATCNSHLAPIAPLAASNSEACNLHHACSLQPCNIEHSNQSYSQAPASQQLCCNLTSYIFAARSLVAGGGRASTTPLPQAPTSTFAGRLRPQHPRLNDGIKVGGFWPEATKLCWQQNRHSSLNDAKV